MFTVIAGKYDDNEMNCKYSSDAFKTPGEAIEDYDRVSGYPWAYIEYNGRIIEVWAKGHAPFN